MASGIKPRRREDVSEKNRQPDRKTYKKVLQAKAAKPVRLKPAHERFAALVNFLAFAHGENTELPGVGLRFTRATMVNGAVSPPPPLVELRAGIARTLRQVAQGVSAPSEPGKSPPPKIFDLPRPPASQLHLIGQHVAIRRASYVGTDIVESLCATLEKSDLSRLKICPICDGLFVALNVKSRACPPPAGCGNTLRQRDFEKKEQKKREKRAEYEENRKRKAKQRRLDMQAARYPELVEKSKTRAHIVS
jgi:hypothetical protein